MKRKRYIMVRVPVDHHIAQPQGRLSDFDEDVAKDIIADVRNGTYRYIASAAAGLSKSRFELWTRKGRESIEAADKALIEEGEKVKLDAYGEFVRELNSAENKAHSDIVRDIVNCDDQRVKLKFIELRYGRHYRSVKNEQYETQGSDIDVVDIVKDKIKAIIEDRNNNSRFDDPYEGEDDERAD